MFGEGIVEASPLRLIDKGPCSFTFCPIQICCYTSIVETLQKNKLVEKSFRRIFLSPKVFFRKSLIRRQIDWNTFIKKEMWSFLEVVSRGLWWLPSNITPHPTGYVPALNDKSSLPIFRRNLQLWLHRLPYRHSLLSRLHICARIGGFSPCARSAWGGLGF